MLQRWVVGVSLVCLGLLSAAAQEREATPAVVHPALRSPLRQILSLDGEWEFAMDAAGVGEAQEWFGPDRALPHAIPITVPGSWEAQGVGGPGNSVTVTPERSIRPLRGSYVGTAWYRKAAVLPRDWARKEVWLKIGGVHAQGWFWVNGTYIGHNDCYCGAYKYNITDLVKPGQRVVITAKVRNDVASRKGLMSWIQRFGGLYRSVELEATPALFIEDAYVVGDLDRRRCTVRLTLRRAVSGAALTEAPTIRINIATLDGTPAGSATVTAPLEEKPTFEVAVPVSLDPFRAWSPEEPNLYRADIVLKVGEQAIDGWVERFGVRKWEVRTGDFYLNNRRYFLRGYGDDFVYPLSIVSPASREVHRQHLQLAKAYGFAYVRHHTHCELPEFYEAADEIGIMVQPELPYYGSTSSAGAPGYFQPKQDLTELYRHYRRYASLATYCTGNEAHLGSPIDREVYQLAKALDPTRLALHQDGGANHKDNSDFHQGPVVPWKPGTQDGSWPFDAHEYLNLATSEDPRLAAKYTGAILPPITPEDFRSDLARTGLSWEWGLATLDAGSQLQRIYQKRGLEQARLDPACDGYIYWTIVDVGSPSAQGLFNQFWEPKASTAEYFRQFNSPTVLLASFSPTERILGAGEELKVEWWISNFGAKALHGQALMWRLERNGTVLTIREQRVADAEPGEVKLIGNTEIKVPTVDQATRMQLVGALPGLGVNNTWDLWFFPARKARPDLGKGIGAGPRLYALLKDSYPGLTEVADPARPAPALLLTEHLDATATNALAQGRSVLLLSLPGPKPGTALGWWALSKQAGTAIAAHHPAFGDFPHQLYMDEVWFHLVGHTISATNEALRQVEPLMVGRGSAGYLLHVFQARAGRGKLLASGLNLLGPEPEARFLLDQFIAYARSPEFAPQGEVDPDALARSLSAGTPLNGWSQTIHASEFVDYAFFQGEARMAAARQTDGTSAVAWKTKPANADPARPRTFTWIAGLGYVSEPSGKFNLFLGAQPLLELDVTRQNTTWRSTDGNAILKYTVRSADDQDSSGLMELTLPGSLVRPGEPADLRVVGSAANSRRWFGLYEVDTFTP
jgi:beta-galactosidase